MSVFRVYIAAPIGRVSEASGLATELRNVGCAVTSRWIDNVIAGEDESTMTRDRRQSIAANNVADITASNVLVLLADRRGRGSLVEFGIARGIGIPTIVLGSWQDTTCMVDLRVVLWADSAASCVALLSARSVAS